MATSGFTDVVATKTSSGKTADTLQFSWTRTGYSIADNTSTIYWELKLIAGAYGYIASSAAKSWSVNVNGTPYSGTNTVGISANTTKVLAYGTTTISHNSDGSKTFSYSFSQYFGISFNGSIGTVSGSGSATLNNIPRKATFTSVSNFDDITSPTIYFNHPAGSALELQAGIFAGDTVIANYRVIDGTKGWFTFNIDEVYDDGTSIKSRIWNESIKKGSDTIDVTFRLATWIGNPGFEFAISNSVSCVVTDCSPEITKATVIDDGGYSTRLTGSPSILIRRHNYVIATIECNAKKNASIVAKYVTCGTTTKKIEDDYAVFENVSDNNFKFTVVDSRGKQTTTPITPTMVNYIPLTCNVMVDRDLDSDNNAKIHVTAGGKYYKGSFGAIENSLRVQYRYKSSSEADYPEVWTPLEPTITDGEYTAIGVIENLEYKETYTLQVRAIDEINPEVKARDEIVKIIPVYDWGENDFNFNVPVTIQGRNVSTHRMARAYTQEADISYAANSYIKLFRDGSPTNLYDQSIATFNENGTITINKDMIALINFHIVTANSSGRSWLSLMNYGINWKYTDCINYGSFTTSQTTIILRLTKNTVIGIKTAESIVINSSGLVGSYIEIIEL